MGATEISVHSGEGVAGGVWVELLAGGAFCWAQTGICRMGSKAASQLAAKSQRRRDSVVLVSRINCSPGWDRDNTQPVELYSGGAPRDSPSAN